MMHSNAPLQNLSQLRPGSLAPVMLLELLGELCLLSIDHQLLTFELFGDFPTHVSIEAKDEGGRESLLLIAL